MSLQAVIYLWSIYLTFQSNILQRSESKNIKGVKDVVSIAHKVLQDKKCIVFKNKKFDCFINALFTIITVLLDKAGDEIDIDTIISALRIIIPTSKVQAFISEVESTKVKLKYLKLIKELGTIYDEEYTKEGLKFLARLFNYIDKKHDIPNDIVRRSNFFAHIS